MKMSLITSKWITRFSVINPFHIESLRAVSVTLLPSSKPQISPDLIMFYLNITFD